MTGFNSKRAAAADKVQEHYDQTALELCNVCGWKTLIPDDGCLNCERAQPTQDVDYWIREATAARQAEMAMRRELESLAQPAQELLHIVQSNGKHSPLLTHMMSKRTTPPQPAQEPTGMLHIDRLGQWLDASLKERKRPWVGLTDEELADCLDISIQKTCRAVEAKLKEKNT